MNKQIIADCLDEWTQNIASGRQRAKQKVDKQPGGRYGRIKRTTGQPIVFDIEFYQTQQKIQNQLCRELPHLASIIKSQPSIMDGYKWTRNDFIDLYFNYFEMIVEKIRAILNNGQ